MLQMMVVRQRWLLLLLLLGICFIHKVVGNGVALTDFVKECLVPDEDEERNFD